MENMLKEKYNQLLERYNNGIKFVEQNPDNQEALDTLNSIQDEMNNILKSLGNVSDEEIQNGFKIEPENNKAITTTTQTQQIQTTNTIDFSRNWEMAQDLSKSDILPDNYKNKPQNVVIAIGIANQMNLDPFTVMQNLSIIRGKASWSGSFCRTLIERTRKFINLELNYIGEKGKDSYGCYLSATRVSDGKIIKGPEVTMAMAKAEKWTSNTKWISLSELMLAYRCQSYFCRVYCPEAMNGIYTSEEIEDISTPRQQPIDIL